jgi:hypothetical protein
LPWWYIPLIVIEVYLLLSLGPAVAAQFLMWALLRAGSLGLAEEAHLAHLRAVLAERAQAWPPQIRPGRYAETDQLAHGHLGAAQLSLQRVHNRLVELSEIHLRSLTPVDAFTLRAWRPLLEAARAARDVWRIRRELATSEEHLRRLLELARQVDAIPQRVRGQLNEARAEIRRLTTVIEDEQELGTQNLEPHAQRLQATSGHIERGLDRLAEATPAEVPAVVDAIDAQMETLLPHIAEVDQLLSNLAARRHQAENAVQRVRSALALLQERWAALQERGAREPSLGQSLSEMATRVGEIEALYILRTPEAYGEIASRVADLDGQMDHASEQIGSLDTLLQRSRAAIEGDVRALAEAHALCDQLVKQDPLIEPDQSLVLLERASQAYMQAEGQHGSGTRTGFVAALELSEQGQRYLEQTLKTLEPLSATVQRVRVLLESLASESRGDWRTRAIRVREALQMYPKHWDAGPAGDVAAALSSLEEVELDLERLPPNVRFRRKYRQSETREALDILEHARQTMEHAKELIIGLEQAYQHITAQREVLVEALDALAHETLPQMDALSEHMLPELTERYVTLREAVAHQMETYADPAQVDYDAAVEDWLPAVLRQLDELRVAHDSDNRHYVGLLKETQLQIDRAWARLVRLNPKQVPGPSEDVESLATAVEDWQRAVTKAQAAPQELRELLGRQAAVLMQRIEGATQEISEGRRELENLERQARRRIQAVRDLRAQVHELRRASQWSKLQWNIDDVEKAWEQVLTLEKQSRNATVIGQVTDQLQRALNGAQQVEQSYASIEHQLRSALRRLDEEHRALSSSLERGQARAVQLQEQGLDEDAAAVAAACASAQRFGEMAQQSILFEDALRYLREARHALGRL